MRRRTLACIAVVVFSAWAAAEPVSATVGVPGSTYSPVAHPGDREATLKWLAPNNGGSRITDYVVVAYLGQRALPQRTFAPNGRKVVTAVFPGLVNGNLYRFSVAAVNQNGRGPLSPKSKPTLVGQPLPPRNITAAPGQGQATVSWTAADDNGSPIESYIITPFSGSPLRPQPAHSYHSNATSEVLTGLTPGVQYAFRVRARNRAGVSLPSKLSPAVTPTP